MFINIVNIASDVVNYDLEMPDIWHLPLHHTKFNFFMKILLNALASLTLSLLLTFSSYAQTSGRLVFPGPFAQTPTIMVNMELLPSDGTLKLWNNRHELVWQESLKQNGGVKMLNLKQLTSGDYSLDLETTNLIHTQAIHLDDKSIFVDPAATQTLRFPRLTQHGSYVVVDTRHLEQSDAVTCQINDGANTSFNQSLEPGRVYRFKLHNWDNAEADITFYVGNRIKTHAVKP